VINAPFKADAIPKPEAVPVWKQDWLIDLVRSGATPAALVLVALTIVFGFMRPALKAASTPPAGARPGEQLDVVADDTLAMPLTPGAPMLEAPAGADRLAAARQVAKDNPAAVANIVRDWVKAED
jgi:flagellar M-ring protein FliF